MSVSLTRSEGVTVLTLTSDPSSACPPLCQLLGALCYSPKLCSRSPGMVLPRRGSQAVLGALWMVNGVLQAALGGVLLSAGGAASYQLRDTWCPVWLGGIFLLLGVCCVLTERRPRPCSVLLSGIFNLFGAAMSITAIVWYCTQLSEAGFYSMCYDDYYYWDSRTTPSPSPEKEALRARCLEGRRLLRALVYGIGGVLLTLAVLGLCLGISSATLSFKALCAAKTGKPDSQALLQEGKEPTEEKEG
ncbi:unnamed protein product [Knipowitschia caucasica]